MELMTKFKGMAKRGQMGGGIIGLIVAAILIAAVGIPVVDQVITDNNFTGTTATILNLVPVGMALSLLILAFGLARR